MQVAASSNPVSTRSASAAAKPPAPANGAFGATLAASITNSAPVRSALASEKKPTPRSNPGLDAKANSKSDAQSEVQAGVQSGANTGAKSTPKTSPQSGVPFASHSAPELDSKSGTNTDSDPHATSNKKPPVANPSATAPVPQAANNIAVAIDNLPLPTQLLVMPLPGPAAVAVGAIPNKPTSQLAAAPMSSDDANSEVNAAAISPGMPKLNLSVPGGGGAGAKSGVATAQQLSPLLGTDATASDFSAAASPKAPNPAGADSPAALAGAQAHFPAQVSGPATQTVEASSMQTPPPPNFTVTVTDDTVATVVRQTVIAPGAPAPQPPPADPTQQASEAPPAPTAAVAVAAAASTPAAPQPNASEGRTLRIDPTVRVFSLTSSAPTPKSPLPGVKPAPASDPTDATQAPSQKPDRPRTPSPAIRRSTFHKIQHRAQLCPHIPERHFRRKRPPPLKRHLSAARRLPLRIRTMPRPAATPSTPSSRRLLSPRTSNPQLSLLPTCQRNLMPCHPMPFPPATLPSHQSRAKMPWPRS